MTIAKDKELRMMDFDKKKEQRMDLWFRDGIEYGHGCSLHIKIKNVLYTHHSKFQEITVMETEKMGKILVIDGVTMLTEYDEHAYHEMIAHVPMLAHPKPSRILVIGGGDGGTVRELLKHPEVESIHVCEIDEAVVDACIKHLPSLASSFSDSRVKIFYEDGAKFVSRLHQVYDIIIVDSTDPFGPGLILFQKPFYEDMNHALAPQGIVVTQCESIYLHGEVIKGVYSFAKDIYPKIAYYLTVVPTYPSGVIGFLFCSKEKDPIKDIDEGRAMKLEGLRYYTPDVHRAAFSLPAFTESYFE